jgi:sugar O-acyltransferase (sialic acid O-acetyltransferase NeuD family)
MEIIIVGASGFGRELLQYVRDIHGSSDAVRFKGFLDDDPTCDSEVRRATGVGLIGDTRNYEIGPDDRFVISVGDPGLRQILGDRLKSRGAEFLSLIHPVSYVASNARLGLGCIVGPYAYVGASAKLGDHVLVNLYSAAGHDTVIGSYSVFSPHAVANGGSSVGERVFLGSHAVLTPKVKVGCDSKVAAGAVVYRTIPDGSLAAGNPATAVPLDSSETPSRRSDD